MKTRLPSDRHIEKLVSVGGRLVGLCEGVLYQMDRLVGGKLPPVAHWKEAITPTRQILHISAPHDGSRLTIQDPSHAYDLDQRLRVVSDRATRDLRFYGPNPAVYADVDVETGDMSTSTGASGTKVVSAAFTDADHPVALSREEFAKGVRHIYSSGLRLFYISRRLNTE